MERWCGPKSLTAYTALLIILGAQLAWAGYGIDAGYDSGTRVLTYHIYVESGSPPPFMDFHVEVNDGNQFRYQLLELPSGWEMRPYTEQGPPYIWLSFYGDSACTDATFRVRYIGPNAIANISRWRLTDDGDHDATTGVIPGEGGTGVPGPWNVGVNTNAKVAVHVMPHAVRTCTDGFPEITDCSDIVATCTAGDVDFFPVFFDLDSYAGIEYSVEWPGTYSCAFTSCSDLTIGSIVWPANTVPYWDNTDYVAHAWMDCQPGPIAVPGWGWVYEPGPATITIVSSSARGLLQIGSCDGSWNEPVCSFSAGIGGLGGQAPCGPARTAPGTWGKIKSIFK